MSRMMEDPMAVASPLGIPLSRIGSGTAWVPDASPMYAIEGRVSSWTLMLQGAAFGQYDDQGSFRGDRQFGLIDSEMLMALRPLAGGLLRFNVMTSFESFFVGERGYPELLQTGGAFDGARLTNRQHPHDLLTELAADFEHSITSKLATSVYVAAAGEPALGPVSYGNRPSAEDDPFAPLGHHWEDAAHGSDGVVTLGVYTRALKLEGSAFNGREPDDYRFNLDYTGARLDSYSGRVTAAPNANLTMSAWAGYVYGHDRLDDPTGMQRYGASILTVRNRPNGGAWTNGIVWGMNIHHHSARFHSHEPGAKTYTASAALLLESSIDLNPRTSVYGRIEQVQKTADDLGFLGGEPMQLFTIRALSLGATRELHAWSSLSVGFGARGTLNFLPETLRFTYDARTPVGGSIFLRVRPVRMAH